MPAVKKSLRVHLQQGFKSRFNKTEREDTIGSVCRMNRVIFHIAEIVEEDNDITLWPCIDHGGHKVNPLRDVRVTQTIEKEDPQYFLLKTWPFFQEGEETMKVRDWLIAINSKGQLMIAAIDDIGSCALLKLFDRNGNLLQSLQLKLPLTEGNSYRKRVLGIASDRANNKTEHVIELNFSKENLALYNKDGKVVREIKLKLSALNDLDDNEPQFTVTTQGLVAILATEKRTGKRMIVIL
ncbi:hypothetical protein P5673_033735 [Acropora cervicornis]|uniref:Uncharacterized protein n=1 Tax=Acropora cervicornis TaxID=6130 RepID=A0AAD9PPJ9_ACRCE|nr:hypothetical protein P5673_033735 [Acropora cervicornis]